MKVIIINNNNRTVLYDGTCKRLAKDLKEAAIVHYPNSKVRLVI